MSERWELRDFMQTLAEEADSNAEAARVLGLSRAGARYWFEKHGISPPNYYSGDDEEDRREEPHTRRDVRPWRDEATLRYYCYDRLCSQREAAVHLGCHRGTVGTWLREHGLEMDLRRREAMKLTALLPS